MEELRVIEYINYLRALEAELTIDLDPVKDYKAWNEGYQKALEIGLLRMDLTNALQAILDVLNKENLTTESKYKMIIK